MKCRFVLHLLLFGCVAGNWPPHLRREGTLKAPYLPEDTPLPKAQWIDQKLDHFGAGSTATWKQRYFVNSSWWDSTDGPVFFLLGGEGPANPKWVVANTHIMLNAQKYNALVFSIEHRFYGDSHPTEDASTANLKYLSSRQALADFAYFHDLMVVKYNMTSKNRWVSFGGSYSGALSAWLRQLYPDAMVGAVATSSPVLAKFDFVEYVEVVEASLNTIGSANCPTNVGIAAAYVQSLLKDKAKWGKVEKLFHVEKPLSSDMDTIQLMGNLAGNFEGIVQYNRDNTGFEGRSNNITITDLCSVMTNGSLGIPLLRYAAVNKLLLGNDSQDGSYSGMLKLLSNSSWQSDGVAGGGRQWTYQTCTEFGYFQTTNSEKSHLFSNTMPLEYFTEMCSSLFGLGSDEVSKAVDATNTFYGGKNVSGTNIIFPNGSIDPWHVLSITSTTAPTLHAIFIEGTAHCANMYPPRDSDLEALTTAREKITDILGEWVVAPV